MNVAFYGKGGSGKSTISALFATFLDDNDCMVGLLDADVNSQTAGIVGATVDNYKILSREENEIAIWQYLSGSNPRVNKTEFLNTTPPGAGSRYWEMNAKNYLTNQFGQAFGNRSHVFTVGSYKPEKLGNGCHHGTQMIAENMISHARLAHNDWLIIDSVAGNDAFGTTLFLNDILVFVVKPEREGIAVLHQFLELAEHAGVLERVFIIGNQVTNEAQTAFLKREIPTDKLIGLLPVNQTIINRRLDDMPLGIESLGSNERALFDEITTRAKNLGANTTYRYESLVKLHQAVSNETWVTGSYRAGLTDQIDPDYTAV